MSSFTFEMVLKPGGKKPSNVYNLTIYKLKQGSPFKIFEKGIGFFKKESVEDVLLKQMQKQEYYDDGGSGGSGPGGSGGGGGGGSGGSGDESLGDEIVQVVMATIGFVFLVIFFLPALLCFHKGRKSIYLHL